MGKGRLVEVVLAQQQALGLLALPHAHANANSLTNAYENGDANGDENENARRLLQDSDGGRDEHTTVGLSAAFAGVFQLAFHMQKFL